MHSTVFQRPLRFMMLYRQRSMGIGDNAHRETKIKGSEALMQPSGPLREDADISTWSWFVIMVANKVILC